MSEDVQAQATQETAAEQGAEQKAPELTINDLQALKMIIDVASQRGTFKANEMASVGQVYNRLETFLASVAPQKEEAPKQ
jgi:hypothetical protein